MNENYDMSQGTFEIIWDELYDDEINPVDMVDQSDSVPGDSGTVTEEISEGQFFNGFRLHVQTIFDEYQDNQVHSGSTTHDNLIHSCLDPETFPGSAAENTCINQSVTLQADKPILDTPCYDPLPESAQETTEFLHLTDDDVRKMISNEENKNTLKKTMSDIAKFERFLATKNETRPMTTIEPDLLDEYVANFILSVRKPNGDEYEPTSIRSIISSIDRKLKRQKYPHSIMTETTNAFQLSRDALRAKQKSLKRLGKGNKPRKSSPISDHEIEILFEKGILGKQNAHALLNTIWLNNCMQFGLRGTTENYNLRWGDVQLKTSSDGLDYLELQERQTKTRTGCNVSDIREITPKIYSAPFDLERCPVEIYKEYAKRRPLDFCEPNDPFYLAPRTSSQKCNTTTWFMKMNLGEKKIGSFLKKMAADGGLDSNKRLTNHSSRKRLVQKLRDSGIAPTDIIQISGHKNIQSVLNYSAMSEEKQRICSHLLSNTRKPASRPTPAATMTSCSTPLPPSHSEKADQNFAFADPETERNKDVGQKSPVSTVCPISHDITNINVTSCSKQLARSSETIDRLERNIKQNGQNDLPLPVSQPGSCPNLNSMSFQNDSLSINREINSLFSGAVLNIQNFHIHMK